MSVLQYFLKKNKRYSSYTSEDIRQIFEERMKRIFGHKVDLERSPRSGYFSESIQARWEEFFNGFREGEDTK